MADEDIATPVVSLDPPASDPVVEKEAPREIVDEEVIPDLAPDEEGGETTDDETDELEFGFKKYQVPKALKTAVEEWRAATTKKEQSVAEQAKTLETQRLQQVEASDAELDARASLKSIDAQLAEFAKLTPQDWQAHMQNDPLGTQQAKLHYDMLKEQKTALTETVTKAQTTRTEAAQQSLAKRVQETNDFAAKEIPGWKPELTDKLIKYAMDRKVPEDVIKSNWSPQFYQILHEARIGSLALAKQAAAPKVPAAQQTTPIEPLQTVGTKSAPAARKSLAEMAKSGDMEGYAAARRAGRTR